MTEPGGSPVTQITFNAGENTKTVYYKGKAGGIHLLGASNSAFNNGTQSVDIRDNLILTITSTVNTFGVNKPGQISYSITDQNSNPVAFTKDIYLNLSNTSPYGRFVADPTSMTTLSQMKLTKLTSMGSVYYRNSLTGNYTATISRDGFSTANFNATIKNQLTFANTSKTVTYGGVTSKYVVQMLTPMSQSGTKSK